MQTRRSSKGPGQGDSAAAQELREEKEDALDGPKETKPSSFFSLNSCAAAESPCPGPLELLLVCMLSIKTDLFRRQVNKLLPSAFLGLYATLINRSLQRGVLTAFLVLAGAEESSGESNYRVVKINKEKTNHYSPVQR